MAAAAFVSLLSAAATCLLVLCIGPAIKVFLSHEPGKVLDFSRHITPIQEHLLSLFLDLGTLNASILFSLPLIIVSLSFFKSITTYFGKSMWSYFAEEKAHMVRHTIVKNYLDFDASYSPKSFERIDKNLAALVGTDTVILKEYLTRFYGDLPKELITAVLLGLLAFYLAPYLSCILVFVLGPVSVGTSQLSKKIKKRSKAELDLYSHMSEWVQERLYGLETIKQFRTEEIESRKLNTLSNELQNKYIKTARARARTSPLSEVLMSIAIASIVYIVFRSLYSNNQINNNYLTFFAALAVLSQSIKSLTRYFNFYNEAVYAKGRLESALNLGFKKSSRYLVERSSEPNSIEVENVDYKYASDGAFKITNLSYKFFADNIYVICGYSGSGKSSLSRLVTGLAKADAGSVKVTFDQRQPAMDMVFVPQAIHLLPGKVADNIHYPNLGSPDIQAIEDSVQKCSFEPAYFHSLDDIQEDGSHTLSGGESQRVLLSRIFYHKPNVILVDEGTSALDEIMESKVLKEISALKKGRITIIIAHRKSAFQYADEILYMENGQLVCSGNLKSCLKHETFRKFYEN